MNKFLPHIGCPRPAPSSALAIKSRLAAARRLGPLNPDGQIWPVPVKFATHSLKAKAHVKPWTGTTADACSLHNFSDPVSTDPAPCPDLASGQACLRGCCGAR